MAVTLDAPISWIAAVDEDAQMLGGLQPNILKSHTREFFTILFLKFNVRDDGMSFLRELATDGINPALMKSAMDHLLEVETFKQEGTPGTPYVGVGISARGYDLLGVPKQRQPADVSFQKGMTHNETVAALGDPDVDTWDGHFRQEIHAAIMVGDQLAPPHNAALARIKQMIAERPTISLLGQQKGNGLRNKNGDGIEHFGYVDGRSQPLFLIEDIESETLNSDGTTNWNPRFGLSRVIVPDPCAPDSSIHFGSYFVFRKLEQDVKAFKKKEAELARALDLSAVDAERAGAMLVGRFEDGTPLTTQSAEGNHNPVPNDFTYNSDPDGGKCPYFAHIRKMNPRGSGGFEAEESERLHIMARRGQTYGVRTDDPNDGKVENKPSEGVGLLFMAFNSSIGEQFEFVQMNWANNGGFPSVPPGRLDPGPDLVIGHGARPQIDCPVHWGANFEEHASHRQVDAVAQTVTMRGGEYFFAPSLPFLRTLGD
ncbi:hypothetical protein [Novosphingobium sp. AP12]|uniref:Dyp-type peroxidase n=1 Tax=Novosphingobium sp. AP12 TaxID=1144305 RepID=UPI000271E1D5|nr:hypothetical protein [Novosphingobium sp. AP12]EJL35381.1 hypothetical protein PMI02_00057 [Novosphingobium sp. AP12]